MSRPLDDRSITRRSFLTGVAVGAAGVLTADVAMADGSPTARDADDLVQDVEQVILRRGGAGKTTWFHPRACTVPDVAGSKVLMTLQAIHGSDHFGPVHWMESPDRGTTWTEPQPIPALGRIKGSAGIEEGVCDVVPEYHPATKTVLAIGHNVFYNARGFFLPQPPRWPVYAVRDASGNWSERRRLEWDDPRTTSIYSCGCAQRITRPDGRILIPMTMRPKGRDDAVVTTVLADFDGAKIAIQRTGSALRLPVKRGLLEPSLAAIDGRYFLTIRAEDGHGYVSTSDDGLTWAPIAAWCWDDGQPLTMSTTQQRWLVHSDALYLVYTRKSAENAKVFRWRAPLYMARVDRGRMRLVRASERVAVPLEGDPQAAPQRVQQLGNFHTVAVGPRESWVTVGTFDTVTWQGSLRLARIRWKRPNRLAAG